LRVIDCKTGEPASELKYFIRNMTIPIRPLEVFISLISPTRRLVVLLANTKLELSEKKPVTSILLDLKDKKITQTTILTLIVGVIYMGGLSYLMNKFIRI